MFVFQVINSPHVINEACTVSHCKFYILYFKADFGFKFIKRTIVQLVFYEKLPSLKIAPIM